MTQTIVKRGTFIVFEGCDRSGKTTVGKKLVDFLNDKKLEKAKFMRFPDRTTEVGSAINDYLKGQKELDDHVIHLLFSANRWEKVNELKQALMNGTHVIVDRYAFSGVAFSAAKPGIDLDWCRQPDRGLPRPDLVCLLDVSGEEAKKRGGYGDERYEREDFQANVRKNYDRLFDADYWKRIDTDGKSQVQVYEEVHKLALEAVEGPKSKETQILWPLDEN